MTKMQSDYEKDFYAWTIHNAELIRQGKFSEMDIEHVAEEIESMGRSDKRALMSRLSILIVHLLKWKYQPVRRGNSWRLTIKEQRIKLMRLLDESPSLRHELELKIHEAYEDALVTAAKQTGLSETSFPTVCPFNFSECVNDKFFPE